MRRGLVGIVVVELVDIEPPQETIWPLRSHANSAPIGIVRPATNREATAALVEFEEDTHVVPTRDHAEIEIAVLGEVAVRASVKGAVPKPRVQDAWFEVLAGCIMTRGSDPIVDARKKIHARCPGGHAITVANPLLVGHAIHPFLEPRIGIIDFCPGDLEVVSKFVVKLFT